MAKKPTTFDQIAEPGREGDLKQLQLHTYQVFKALEAAVGELIGPSEVDRSEEAKKRRCATLISDAESLVERLGLSEALVGFHRRYTKRLHDLRALCQESLEERTSAQRGGQQWELEREQLIGDITALFKRAIDGKALDYPARFKLLSEVYAALEVEIDQRPKSPPGGQFYAERPDATENAPAFIGRVYKDWLTGEFTRADLRRMDPKGEMALRNWERKHGRASLNLPTLEEKNDALVKAVDLVELPQGRTGARLRMMAEMRKRRTP